MREIKFRVSWFKKIYQISVIDWYNNGEVNRIKVIGSDKWLYPNLYPNDDIVVMQYTGLKDKNGVEIFEGDVVRYNFDIWEIFWQETFCRFAAMPTDGRLDTLPLETRYASEVIGNIYENPDLLTTTTRGTGGKV